MSSYVVHHKHAEGECPALMDAIMKEPWSKRLKGVDFYCGCPYGTHESFVAVEAASSDEALSYFDSLFKAGAVAFESIPNAVIGENDLLPVR